MEFPLYNTPKGCLAWQCGTNDVGGLAIHMLEEGASLIGYLTTTGRVTSRPHTVALRLVYHRGKVYASRRDAWSDWCRNLLKNPNVTVEIQGCQFPGTACLVTDEALCREISQLKYSGPRTLEKRTVVQITPIT